MKLKTLITLLTLNFTVVLFVQSQKSSIYQNLETKKLYAVNLSFSNMDGREEYRVNDKKVSKSTYQKYNVYRGNRRTCTPCILKMYNTDDVLIREGVYYTDCGIGSFKEYYPSGRLKLRGQYKENDTEIWEDIGRRGLCNIRDGQWTYYSEEGKRLYVEFWENGELIKQVPEQKTGK